MSRRPKLRMQLCLDPPGWAANLNTAIPLTAMAAVKAIPYVVEAEPGFPTDCRSLGSGRVGRTAHPSVKEGRNESPISGSTLWDRPDR